MKTKRYDKSIAYISTTLLVVAHTLAFSWIWYNVYLPALMIPFEGRGSYVIVFLFTVFLLVSNHIFGGLRMGYYKVLDSIVARTLSLFSSYFVMYVIVSLLSYRLVSIQYIALAIAFGFLFNIFWTLLSNYVYFRINPPRKMLLIYGNSSIREVCNKITSRSEKYEIVKRLHYSVGEETLKQYMVEYEAVILYDLSATLRNHLMKYCYEKSIRVYITPKLYDIMIRGADDMDLFDTPFLLMRNRGLSPLQLFVKRGMDIVLSVICLIITSPIMLLIVIFMKCFDHGPVLYRQTRLTIGGKEFEILKFRSMYVDAEKDAIRLMSKDDNRITAIGKVLRRTHLDELPQLFNIIKGDMSFVGPRPERPEIADIYMEKIPEFEYRLKMKAGLTGYAQVYGKYNSNPYDKLRLDFIYIQNYSVFLDLRLLLLTGKTLFIPDHTEGVDISFNTALQSEIAVTDEQDDDKDID